MREQTSTLGWGVRMSRQRTGTTGDADDGLIARFLAGDGHAFEALFRKYQDYVYNIVFGIVGRAEDARDLTQDVFVQAYRSLPAFRRGARFPTWLYRIAVNRAVDAARKEKHRRWLPINEAVEARPDPSANPALAAVRQDEQDAVRQILMQVPVRHRDVLVLRYYQEMSVEEIAEVLGCSVPAAKVRLHRARLHFKERYVAAHGEEERAGAPLR